MTTSITGYRELTLYEVEMINTIKAKGQELETLIKALRDKGPELDQRWVSIGATHMQEGLMALVRGVAQPTSF